MNENPKLVRNRIPEIIEADLSDGKKKKAIIHTATPEEFEKALIGKLDEEVAEFRESGEIEELADIMETVEALGYVKGINLPQLNRIKKEKAEKKGSFSHRTILERIEE